MCGSKNSSTTTGTSGSTGTISCLTMRMNSQSFGLIFSLSDGLNRPICGALAARWDESRIISNFATSEDCSVNPPKRIQRRHPFSGAMVRVTASMASTTQYSGLLAQRRKR